MKPPKDLASSLLFPEYNILDLDFKKDKYIIIPRVLEYGTFKQTRWLIRFYSKKYIKKFIKKYGAKKLSLVSLNFWLNMFDINRKLLNKKLTNKFWSY